MNQKTEEQKALSVSRWAELQEENARLAKDEARSWRRTLWVIVVCWAVILGLIRYVL